MIRGFGWGKLLLALALTGCAGDAPRSTAEHGRELFESGALSPSRLNAFSCRTCHDAGNAADPAVTKTGADLAGATLRPSYWGGQELDLLRAIDACRRHFMISSVPLEADAPDAQALYAYLVSLEPGDSRAVPFSVVQAITDLPRGDARAGEGVYARTCQACHGAMHGGTGRLSTRIAILPDDAIASHAEYTAAEVRLIFIEKVRHGGFLGYGGDMPPYSLETLPDSELSDLLEALGVLGE